MSDRKEISIRDEMIAEDFKDVLTQGEIKERMRSATGKEEVADREKGTDSITEETKEKTTLLKVNYKDFIFNNWTKKNDNEILEAIKSAGGAVWLSRDGDLFYRLHHDELPIKAVVSKTRLVMSNLINKSISIISSKDDKRPDIGLLDLKLVARDEFNPFKLEEFYTSGSIYIRNTFKPTPLMLEVKITEEKPETILNLINHLVNNDKERLEWVINWLAYFFQTLKRSQVSLLLRGSQGAGKGIFFDEVIKELFGADQTIQINDKSLQTQFLGSIIEGRLFYNLDEVQHDLASSKKIKNFLKALVTNNGIVLEKKFENMERETPLYGQVLITSNEPYALEIEPSDRRFTVYTTGDKLESVNWLGFNSYHAMSVAIGKELQSFANYLYSYKVDTALANTAQDTEEKEALVGATTDRFQQFAHAIKRKDLVFFESIKDSEDYNEMSGAYLLSDLKADFEKSRVNKSSLKKLFELIYEEEISSKKLLSKLRVVEPRIFNPTEEVRHGDGKRFFTIQ